MGLGERLKRWFRGGVATGPATYQRSPMQFDSDADVERYVESQLTKGLPPDWSLRRDKGLLVWRIVAEGLRDFILQVSSDRKFFILYHGNSDAGGLSLHHVLLNAKVIKSDTLCYFSLAEAVADVIGSCEPNQWGLT
jgi:hypothetical protein